MKRQRIGTEREIVYVKRRPRIDKQIISINETVTNTQVERAVWSNNYTPCNIGGIRWDLSFVALTTGVSYGGWAIVRVNAPTIPDPSTISFTSGSTFYAPEENVLTFGTFTLADTDGATGSITYHTEGHIKTTRNMDIGDILYFIILGNAANVATVVGAIQFFIKV